MSDFSKKSDICVSGAALPDDQTGFCVADAHGARNSSGHSVAQRLKIRAVYVGDQIESTSCGMHFADDGTIEGHFPEFLHQVLNASRLSFY